MQVYTWHDFAKEVLKLGGWRGHINNFVSLVGWMNGEGTEAKYNPFATTRLAPGATDFNSSHVRNYPDLHTGVKATVDTMHNGNYEAILKEIRRCQASFYTLSAVRDSPWGTFHVPTGAHPFNIATFVENLRGNWSDIAFQPVRS